MVSSLDVGLTVLIALFGSAMLAMAVGRLLPEHHLNPETRTTVTAVMAVVGTMSALVIGLLIANATRSFALRNNEVAHVATDIVQLDSLLRRYGPEAGEARNALGGFTRITLAGLSREHVKAGTGDDGWAGSEALARLEDSILNLAPGNDMQHWFRDQALRLASELGAASWLVVQEG